VTVASREPHIVYLRPNTHSLQLAVAEEVTRVELTRRLPDVSFEARDLSAGLPKAPVDCVIVEGSCVADLDPASFDIARGAEDLPPAIRPVVWQGVRLPIGSNQEEHSGWIDLVRRGRIVTVVDNDTRNRLQPLCGDLRIDLHPALGLLLPRVVGMGIAQRRLRSLRETSAYPSEGKPLLMEVVGADASVLKEILLSDPPVNVVSINFTGIPDAVLEALAETLPGRFWMIGGHADLEDLAAAIIGAEVVAARSVSLSVSALAYGSGWLPLSTPGGYGSSGLAESSGAEFRPPIPADQLAAIIQNDPPAKPERSLLGPLQAQLDAHFDRVAQVIEHAAWARRRAPSDLGGEGPKSGQPVDAESFSAGLNALGERRLVQDERDALARREQEMGELMDRLGRAEAEISALTGSRTFLYTEGLRHAWARLLRLTGRR
jgi:hypothetical protein